VQRYGEHFIKRKDPRGRTYYWATNDPPPRAAEHETDLSALAKGFVTLTPLQYDMTRVPALNTLQSWQLRLPE
jgi:5'-nucleotidase